MDKKNVLLYTINSMDCLEQVFSTCALYQTVRKQGWNPVVYDEPGKGSTGGEGYVRTHCCTLSQMCLHSDKEKYLNSFETIITGGDKKWQYAKEDSVDKCFLNWGNSEAGRIAYAPTFGEKFDLPLGPRNAAHYLLHNFAAVSVADRATQRILNMEFRMDVERVCNPILLAESFAHEDVKKVEGLFISTFFDKCSAQKQKVVEMAEEILRYKVLDYSKENMMHSYISLDEYLNAIEKSSLVITDSAAAMHLAIVYRKPFIVVLSRQENELFSTLDELGLSERMVYTEEDVREKKYLCRKPIKYGVVDYKLGELRTKSIKWLKDSMNERETDK